MIERTVILSESPGTPGRRQQTPRTERSTRTPACEAAYRPSMTSGSVSPFTLMVIRPASPAAASSAIWPRTHGRMPWGATTMRRCVTGLP